MLECSPATADDTDFLWQMLYYASWSEREDAVSIDDVKANPHLSRHLVGWGTRTGDIAVIARDNARPVGACWIRHLVGDERADPTFVDDETPELAIAVEPDTIGTGVGTALLATTLAIADGQGTPTVVLTTRATNPAVSLYERHGFVEVERIGNRVGTQSIKMVRRRPVDCA